MKFAHFSHVWGKPGMTPHQRYEELWRELQLCDEIGFDYAFCVEHHFRADESWMSSPSLYAIGAGLRTRRLRVGPMGYIVPLYHPLRLVEEIAIIDQMLGGRMELGLVPGINADYFRPFGLDYDLRKSPTLEFIDYMRVAFGAAQPFSFHGKNLHTHEAQLAVQPLQHPYPPVWMMSRDPQTLEFCALRMRSTLAIFLSTLDPMLRRVTGNFSRIGRGQVGLIDQASPTAPSYMLMKPTIRRSIPAFSARAGHTRAFCRHRSPGRLSMSAPGRMLRNLLGAGSPVHPKSWPTYSIRITS